MKTLRKVLSVVLAQVLILTYLPISVSAEDDYLKIDGVSGRL